MTKSCIIIPIVYAWLKEACALKEILFQEKNEFPMRMHIPL